MDIAQRPWIRLSKVTPLGLSVTEAGVIIDLDLHAKNIGHSRAEEVYTTGRIFPDLSLNDQASTARAACEGRSTKPLEFTQSVIFPDEDHQIEGGSFAISQQEITNRWMERITSQYTESIPYVGKEKADARKKEELVQPVFSSFTVIGCIIYSYRDRSASGETAFALDVHKSCETDIGPLKCAFDA